jgi:hypothetical protein
MAASVGAMSAGVADVVAPALTPAPEENRHTLINVMRC